MSSIVLFLVVPCAACMQIQGERNLSVAFTFSLLGRFLNVAHTARRRAKHDAKHDAMFDAMFAAHLCSSCGVTMHARRPLQCANGDIEKRRSMHMTHINATIAYTRSDLVRFNFRQGDKDVMALTPMETGAMWEYMYNP